MHSLSYDQGGALQRLRRLLALIDRGFCKLQRIQFDAPWAKRRGC